MTGPAAMLCVRSYAKINLYLDVLNKRRDGYHNIETIFQTVSLHDDLHLEAQETALALSCSNPDLPVDETNLVLRAARLLREKSGAAVGARFQLEKRIPVAAGLAGGSGNAAAALLGLNTLWKLAWPLERLSLLACELGADVPYCLRGGTMAGAERGEQLTPLPALPETWFVLVHPPLRVSSASVYHHELLTYKTELPVNGRTPSFDTILKTLEQGNIAGIVFNKMEVPVFAQHPELAAIKAQLIRLGCAAAAMSGSGPTLFGLCRERAQAEDIAGQLGPWNSSVVRSVPEGVEFLES
ncbi:MAG: 4-(cytidine 5'-diphospho)-2-C-methyl-D-erythritol kinase [Candidatus Hydrogenedentes bacterium]|nr:4-(cytidine 5'-diphospho)-2-C-methyl-D-erythritol kinase [Candidatus Hydrogenedentota bacterium]MBI3118400.1 4-(cytidine 5'-diphospho)-2-C-methyl-D-erythritol kinase [Candidatus Hydrogenedentota bacterium]